MPNKLKSLCSKRIRLVFIVNRSFDPNETWGRISSLARDKGCQIVGLPSTKRHDSAVKDDLYLECSFFPRDIISNDYLDYESTPLGLKTTGRYFYSNDYGKTHAILLAMMSRRDVTGTYRLPEREIALRKIHTYLVETLLISQPTHIIFDETPHEVGDFALFALANWLKIPCLFFQPIGIGPQLLPRTTLDSFEKANIPNTLKREYRDVFDEAVNISRRGLMKLISGDGTIQVERYKSIDSSNRTLFGLIKALPYLLIRFNQKPNDLISFTGHRVRYPRFRRFLEMYFEFLLKRNLKKSIDNLPDFDALSLDDFCLFALHYEPERSTLPEGLPFLSQFDALLLARDMMPNDMKLLVKEHYTQRASTQLGWVGRSVSSYNYLSEIYGVELIGVNDSAAEIIKKAKCTFTITGKIAIESVLAGVPVIYFGQPWWVGMPGTFAFGPDISFQEITSSNIPNRDTILAWLTLILESRFQFGLGSISPEDYSRRFNSLPENFTNIEVISIWSSILDFLETSTIQNEFSIYAD